MVALDIPLLFETSAQERCDHTICISAPAFIQQQRIKERGMSDDDFIFRMERQMPDAEKRAHADFTIPSGAGLAEMRTALESVIRTIRSKNHGNDHLPSCGR